MYVYMCIYIAPPSLSSSLRAGVCACMCECIRLYVCLSVCLSVSRSSLSLFHSLFLFPPLPVFSLSQPQPMRAELLCCKALVLQNPLFTSTEVGCPAHPLYRKFPNETAAAVYRLFNSCRSHLAITNNGTCADTNKRNPLLTSGSNALKRARQLVG